jgi:pimeloyl-ACP methyl ester carboxylesterase
MDSVASPDGLRLALRSLGSGTPVLMLHGSGGGLHSWEEVAARLSQNHEVWLMARRGHGPSEPSEEPTTIADEAADVSAVLSMIGPSDQRAVHLVGGSYGATVALHVARSEGARLRSLSLYEPPLFAAGSRLVPVLAQYRARLSAGDIAGADLLFLREVANVPPALLAAFAAQPDVVDEREARRSAIGKLHDLEAMASDSEDLARFSAIDVPTLLMQGADTWDPMPSTMDALAGHLPAVERVAWQGQMHFASSVAPDLVADTIASFLARQESSGTD